MQLEKTSFHTYFLFTLVIFLWAVAWPAAKYALAHISPSYLLLSRNLLAVISMFLIAGFSGNLIVPTKRDWPMILFLGVFQIFIFSSLCTYGLQYVDAGHSAILVYTTPIWITPIAYLFFKEKLSKLKLLALLFGLAGIAFLFNPTHLNLANPSVLFGNLILIVAAIVWASVILVTRYIKWHCTPVQIAPWQFLVSTLLIMIVCFFTQSGFYFDGDLKAVFAILFLGIFGTSIAFLCSNIISKQLPATTTSIGLLAVPLLGLLLSCWLFGEVLNREKICAMGFILIALSCSILSDRLNRV